MFDRASCDQIMKQINAENEKTFKAFQEAAYARSAEHVFDVIRKEIEQKEKDLDHEHEIIMSFTSFGHSVSMYVEAIKYKEPHFIFFYGLIDNKKSVLIQHVSQLSFLITVERIQTEQRPPRRIGFGTV
ncbi:MAG: DUF6173 family protein [Bacillota bacterium]|jgi:wyosine [tRNA(Phe)-imidazoG37] synthetase (radical SAM superfamily)|nr:DUF6173 family protein [Bacillota bacterium]